MGITLYNGVRRVWGRRRRILITLADLCRLLFARDGVDLGSGTAFARDAWDVFCRWRRGEELLEGPHITEYEQALSRYYSGREVITFGAGRMALYAILKAMRLNDGDEIIVPGYTCVVIPNAIRYAGLKPVYVDISPRDFNMVPELVAGAITPRTRAILAQATFGIPCDMEALGDISARFGVPIIEDGAHAIGTRWDGQLLGCLGYAGFFSTQSTKMFSTERGGFSVTADADLARRIRAIQAEAEFASPSVERACLLRWCYRAALVGKPELNPRVSAAVVVARILRVPGVANVLDYDLKEYQDALAGRRFSPYPARLPNLMAYAGLLQLERLEEDLAHRRRLACYLEGELPALGAKVAVYDSTLARPSWVRFPFLVKDRVPWIASMKENGLAPGVWLDDPIHPKGCDWRKAGYLRGHCPVAEYVADHILNVPVHRRVAPSRLKKWVWSCRERGLSA